MPFSKYNPNIYELMFGYGPNQLAEYFLSHENIYEDGLILPHSSLFSYLIFFGITGLAFLFCLFFYFLYKNKTDNYVLFLFLFLFINYLKSDALLYFPNFILLLFILNSLYSEKELKEEHAE